MKGSERVKKKLVTEHIDKSIKAVCEKVQKNEIIPEEYAKTVMALAELVKARATLECEVDESVEELEELEELCKPVSKWLERSCHPYLSARITAEHIELQENIVGIPVKKTAD